MRNTKLLMALNLINFSAYLVIMLLAKPEMPFLKLAFLFTITNAVFIFTRSCPLCVIVNYKKRYNLITYWKRMYKKKSIPVALVCLLYVFYLIKILTLEIIS